VQEWSDVTLHANEPHPVAEAECVGPLAVMVDQVRLPTNHQQLNAFIVNLAKCLEKERKPFPFEVTQRDENEHNVFIEPAVTFTSSSPVSHRGRAHPGHVDRVGNDDRSLPDAGVLRRELASKTLRRDYNGMCSAIDERLDQRM
jgi:hypothetical protein